MVVCGSLRWFVIVCGGLSYSHTLIWVVLRKPAPMCDIELVALDLHIWVANRLVQCTTYTV